MIGRPPRPLIERFLAKVKVTASCWEWTGAIDKDGYGRISVSSDIKSAAAHRVSYELFVGPIPLAQTIDHLCHNADPICAAGRLCLHRRCINPAHLEPATSPDNVRRGKFPNALKTECAHGHAYDTANTARTRKHARVCLTCRRQSDRNRRRLKRIVMVGDLRP